MGASQLIKGSFSKLERMLSKYFIIGKLLTPAPGEPGTAVRAVCGHSPCPTHEPQTADTGGGQSACGSALPAH